jgi:hypothetical protein
MISFEFKLANHHPGSERQSILDVDAQRHHQGDAMYAASAVDHEIMVHKVIDAGADVNTSGGYYGYAL